MKSYSKNKGFTLVELVLYIGLLSILIMIMSQMFIAIMKVKLESSSTSAVQKDGTYITTRLAYDIRRADQILSPLVGSSDSSLLLDVVDGAEHRTYTFASSSGTLTISDGISTETLHGGDSQVTQFRVTRVGNSSTVANAKDTIDIVLTVSSIYSLSGGPDELTYRITVGVR